jgi:dihydrofolate reductase
MITTEFTISLDGFIAGPNDDISNIFGWYTSGDTEFSIEGAPTFRVSRSSAQFLQENWSKAGAIVTGRRDFDVSNAWGGKALMNLPMFIVTHDPPEQWTSPGSPFTFVTDGVVSAIEQAQAVASNKTISVGGTQIVQQCLQAGIIDEIILHQVPILLGVGIRLFDKLGPQPIKLEKLQVLDTPDVTHLRFRVVK